MNLNWKIEFKGCLGRDTVRVQILEPSLCTVDSPLPATCASDRGESQVSQFRK